MRLLGLVGLLACFVGCSSLPRDWSETNAIKVSATVDALTMRHDTLNHDMMNDVAVDNMLCSGASVGASVYLQTANTKLSKAERLAEAAGASKQFVKHYYPDVLKGRRLADVIREWTVVGALSPTRSESLQALIIWGVRKK